MPTTLHRLQISLPRAQAQFLRQRAELDGVSMAEFVRRLVEAEAEAVAGTGTPESLWEIAGIAEDQGPLIEGVPVSERPDLYLAEAAVPPRRERSSRAAGERLPSRRRRRSR